MSRPCPIALDHSWTASPTTWSTGNHFLDAIHCRVGGGPQAPPSQRGFWALRLPIGTDKYIQAELTSLQTKQQLVLEAINPRPPTQLALAPLLRTLRQVIGAPQHIPSHSRSFLGFLARCGLHGSQQHPRTFPISGVRHLQTPSPHLPTLQRLSHAQTYLNHIGFTTPPWPEQSPPPSTNPTPRMHPRVVERIATNCVCRNRPSLQHRRPRRLGPGFTGPSRLTTSTSRLTKRPFRSDRIHTAAHNISSCHRICTLSGFPLRRLWWAPHPCQMHTQPPARPTG